MKQVILIHGLPDKEEFYNKDNPSPSNGVWIPWVQKQLGLKDILCQALEFPMLFDPAYEDWENVLSQMSIDSGTVLVGHSCGGGFLLRYLSENKNLNPGKVILVAPWIDPMKEVTKSFFDFEIDERLTERINIHVFISADDDPSVLESVRILKQKLPNATYHEFTDRDHFCDKEFPELLEIIL